MTDGDRNRFAFRGMEEAWKGRFGADQRTDYLRYATENQRLQSFSITAVFR